MRNFFLSLLLLMPLGMMAQNWDVIQSSGEYYWGVGRGHTVAEATKAAMAELTGSIATHVSSEFQGLTDETNRNGDISHESKVLNCIKSYSQATLNNVRTWHVSEEPNATVRCWMKRSELERIYDGRIKQAKDMVATADNAMEKRQIDIALQYYYWAYSLIRSVQRPNEVCDEQGKVLVNLLPLKINEVLSGISVSYEKREGDDVDLLFSYLGEPVNSLQFTYLDGRRECSGSVSNGRSTLEMVSGYETNTYHIDIDYVNKEQTQGDEELHSVLNVVPKKVFPKAAKTVKGRQEPETKSSLQASKFDMSLKATGTQLVAHADNYAQSMAKVTEAIRIRHYADATSCFTSEGLDIYNKLIGYGRGRIVGTPNIQFFKGLNNRVVARGLQMSFSFMSGARKKTFVEDVVFTFNSDCKIENVAFGLGQIAENDILCKYAPGWKDETRELIMEFMENYKTAYCLKRLDYISNIFADDALIIVGNVVRPKGSQNYQERAISFEGQDIIKQNKSTKSQYLKNLKRCFDRNEFINIRFTHNDVRWLEKFEEQEIFAIQIGQEYSSSTYGDKGHLFLMVDMTDHQMPQIKIRTWQPNVLDMDKVYHEGYFYDD